MGVVVEHLSNKYADANTRKNAVGSDLRQKGRNGKLKGWRHQRRVTRQAVNSEHAQTQHGSDISCYEQIFCLPSKFFIERRTADNVDLMLGRFIVLC